MTYSPLRFQNPKEERAEFFQHLTERIHELEASGCRHDRSALSIPALEQILPEQGLPMGSLVELLSAAGAGAWTLGLLLARQALAPRGVSPRSLVVVERTRCFYPPAAARFGVDMERLIVIRHATQRELHVAANLALRCPAVGAVLLCCDRLSALEFRRLQLSAETGGGIGILLREAAALPTPSFATLRLLVSAVPTLAACHRLKVEVVRCRGGKGERSLILEIDDATSAVRVPADVAAAAAQPRPARAAR